MLPYFLSLKNEHPKIPNKIQLIKPCTIKPPFLLKTKGSPLRSSLFIFPQQCCLLHGFLTVHDADLVVDGFVVDGFQYHGYEFFAQTFFSTLLHCLAQDFIPAAGL